LDLGSQEFLNTHYQSTPFIVHLLRISHQSYLEDGSPAILDALKLVIAYDLTHHKTLVEDKYSSQMTVNGVSDLPSRYYAKICYVAMDQEWRNLHDILLQNLSSLYASFFKGDKLRNFPVVLLLSLIVLTIWEDYQIDTFRSGVRNYIIPL